MNFQSLLKRFFERTRAANHPSNSMSYAGDVIMVIVELAGIGMALQAGWTSWFVIPIGILTILCTILLALKNGVVNDDD